MTGWAFHHNRPPGWAPEKQAAQDAAMHETMKQIAKQGADRKGETA